MKIVAAICTLVLAAITANGYAQADSIQGTWQVTAVITATSVPNAYVKEGHMKQETWRIMQQGNQATLTTPNGSIQGHFLAHTPEFAQGVWQFELAVPGFMGQQNLGPNSRLLLYPVPQMF